MNDLRSGSGLPSVLKKLGLMTAVRDTNLVEQSLLRTLASLLDVRQTSLYRVDEQGCVIRMMIHSREAVEHEGVQRVVDNIEEIINDHDIPAVLRNLFESVRLLGKFCCQKSEQEILICYPIFGKSELQGYFVFERRREPSALEDAITQGVLEVFTNYFDLLETSQRDRLTGLLNRYSLEANLDRLWNLMAARRRSAAETGTKATHRHEVYWLGLVDIDHFKNINDTYGHLIGDEVLIMVTRILQLSLRRTDLLYRYGGEEFVVIIAANDLDTALGIFDRTRAKIEQFKFPQVGHVTISGGFSKADPDVLPQEIINRADSSLYAAKNAGRNRIFYYETLLKEGILKEVAAGSVDLF